MRAIKYILPAALALLSMASCEDYPNYIEDSSYVIGNDPKLFAVYPVAQAVPADGGSYTIKVTGTENWNVELAESNSSAEGWCTVSQSSGSGATDITVNVTQSTSFVKNRQMVLVFTNADKVLINGLIWATRNVGAPGTFASDVDEVGYLYQFNRKEGFPFANSAPDFASTYSSYKPAESGWITNAWTDANNPCPEGWRVPTGDEVCGLLGDSEASRKCTWVTPTEKNGFERIGYVAGIDASSAGSVTKENLKSLGGIFIPLSGWFTEGGALDRNWLVVIRTATSLNDNMGGMFLSGYGYTDAWGWGDGQKNRAAPVRCVRKIEIED